MLSTHMRNASVRWCRATFAVACLLAPACAESEAPARLELRLRLGQEARLSDDEMKRVLAEVTTSIAGRRVRASEDGERRDLEDRERADLFALFEGPIGMFDEGLKQVGDGTVRVLNAPGRSDNAEIEAAQRLSIDIATFLPRRYEFAYAFPGYGDHAFDLVVEP